MPFRDVLVPVLVDQRLSSLVDPRERCSGWLSNFVALASLWEVLLGALDRLAQVPPLPWEGSRVQRWPSSMGTSGVQGVTYLLRVKTWVFVGYISGSVGPWR